jgi:hypothetical protein
MKGLKRILFGILILSVPILLQGAGFEVKVIRNAADLPEQFNTLWREGDVLVSNDKNLVLFGGTERILRSYYQYPIEHTLGSVLGYVPKGKGLMSDMVIGSPYIRIKNKCRYLNYSSFSTIPQKDDNGSLVFHAVAHYVGEKGEKVEVTTLYHLNPESGKIDITSMLKNTGSKRLEDLHYSLYCNSEQVYYFSPFKDVDLSGSSASSAVRSRLPFWVYPKKGHYLGWIDLNPIRALYQPISWESVSMNLDPGKSFEARYVLLVDVKAEDLLKKIYQILGVRAAKIKIDTADFHGELMEVVIQDFFRPSWRIYYLLIWKKKMPASSKTRPKERSRFPSETEPEPSFPGKRHSSASILQGLHTSSPKTL